MCFFRATGEEELHLESRTRITKPFLMYSTVLLMFHTWRHTWPTCLETCWLFTRAWVVETFEFSTLNFERFLAWANVQYTQKSRCLPGSRCLYRWQLWKPLTLGSPTDSIALSHCTVLSVCLKCRPLLWKWKREHRHRGSHVIRNFTVMVKSQSGS